MITPIKPYWKSGVQPLPADEELLPKDCDVVIVGAGPAGLSAAVELGRLGVDALVVDEKQRLKTVKVIELNI